MIGAGFQEIVDSKVLGYYDYDKNDDLYFVSSSKVRYSTFWKEANLSEEAYYYDWVLAIPLADAVFGSMASVKLPSTFKTNTTKTTPKQKMPKGAGNLIDSSPIKIPSNAVKVEQAKNGYDQIKYTWSDGTYKYEARWHTRTPGAPADQGNTLVVTRTTPGSQTTRKQQHILTGGNQWTSMKQWQDAVSARQNGVATPEQQALLDSGHWPAP